MTWSPDQETAMKRIGDWLKNGGKRFSLGGYAGTGKTTLAKHIAENVDGEVAFCAFTGKAANVLRSKGCPGATTIHKLIYDPKGDSEGAAIANLQDALMLETQKPDKDEKRVAELQVELSKLKKDNDAMFSRKEASDISTAKLVIVDESSMVDRRIGNDLEFFGVPVLYLGDPGQLQPVKGKAHLVDGDYDYVLEQIHRQAEGSPIIQLASQIRQGKSFKFGSYGDNDEVLIAKKSEWDIDRVDGADQIITGTNASRARLNRVMRKHRDFKYVLPSVGDKLICRQNDHDAGYLNGAVGVARGDADLKASGLMFLDIEYEGSFRPRVICDPGMFEENYPAGRIHTGRGAGVQRFDYGYCITGHKSQGSQWNHVVIADDKMRAFDKEARRRWMYTVFTRAEERLTYYV